MKFVLKWIKGYQFGLFYLMKVKCSLNELLELLKSWAFNSLATPKNYHAPCGRLDVSGTPTQVAMTQDTFPYFAARHFQKWKRLWIVVLVIQNELGDRFAMIIFWQIYTDKFAFTQFCAKMVHHIPFKLDMFFQCLLLVLKTHDIAVLFDGHTLGQSFSTLDSRHM